MDARVEALHEELCEARARFDARPARPDDVAWFAEHIRLMFDADQRYRALYVELVDDDADHEDALATLRMMLRAADDTHQQLLAAWLRDRAWPRRSIFGAEPCAHAWLIALHADRNVPFQEEVMRLMRPAFAAGEVDPVHMAALADRIAINRGEEQRWGMFYRVVDGNRVLYPVAELEGLEARRSMMGLGEVRFRR